jgi:hypothetical protein
MALMNATPYNRQGVWLSQIVVGINDAFLDGFVAFARAAEQ